MKKPTGLRRWYVRILLILIVLCLQPWGQQGMAQQPPAPEIGGIKPNEGQSGEQFQATIWGSGFDQEVEVIIEGLDVEVLRRSEERLLVQLFVPDDASPGPYDVIVINHMGEAQEGILPGGFTVTGEPEPPPPTEPRETSDHENGGGVPWEIIGPLLGLLALIAVPVAAYLGWDMVRKQRMRRQRQQLEEWQEKAEQELSRECRPGAKLPIIGRKVRSDNWEIVHLMFTTRVTGESQIYDDQHLVGGKLVRRLNEIIALRKHTEDEERLRRMAAPVAAELAKLIWLWNKSTKDRQVGIQANIEGRVAYEFKLYECQKTESGNRWQKIKEWEGRVKEKQTISAGHVAGPQQRESKSKFKKRAVERVTGRLLTLISEIKAID